MIPRSDLQAEEAAQAAAEAKAQAEEAAQARLEMLAPRFLALDKLKGTIEELLATCGYMHREDLEKDTTSPDLLSEIEKWENVFALLDEAGEAKNKRVREILGDRVWRHGGAAYQGVQGELSWHIKYSNWPGDCLQTPASFQGMINQRISAFYLFQGLFRRVCSTVKGTWGGFGEEMGASSGETSRETHDWAIGECRGPGG